MSALKQIRGQLRQIVLEMMPSLLTTELYVELHKAIHKENDVRLKAIEEKQRDLQLFIMRATTAPMPKSEPKNEA